MSQARELLCPQCGGILDIQLDFGLITEPCHVQNGIIFWIVSVAGREPTVECFFCRSCDAEIEIEEVLEKYGARLYVDLPVSAPV